MIKNSLKSFLSCLCSPYFILRPHSWNTKLNIIEPRLGINTKLGYVYIRVPKAANSAVVSTLYLYEHGCEPSVPMDAKKSFESIYDLSFEDSTKIKTYYKFIFVRNPYTRILSAYLNKVVSHKDHKYRELIWSRLKLKGRQTPSFSQFCDYLNQGGLCENGHWIPQVSYARPFGGVSKLDFIGKSEDLEDGVKTILNKIFPSQTFQGLSSHKGPQSTNANSVIYKYLNDATTQIINDLYHEDFVLLGYPKKDPETMKDAPRKP